MGENLVLLLQRGFRDSRNDVQHSNEEAALVVYDIKDIYLLVGACA